MLVWILTFSMLSLLAALLGYLGIAATFADIANFLLYAFLGIMVVSFVVVVLTRAQHKGIGES